METDPAKIIAWSNAVRKYALEQGMIDTSMINWVHWIRDWGNGLERSAQNLPTSQEFMDSDCGLIIQPPLSYHTWHAARVLGKEGYKKRVDAWVD